MYNTQAPYIASYIIIRKSGKIAFVLRQNTNWMNGYYGLPSGKVEKDESFTEAVIREAKEEIGVEVMTEDLQYKLTVHRHSPDNGMEWVDAYFEADKWKGDVVNAEPHMHSEVVWLDPNNLPDNVIPAVKESIKAIEDGKTYLEFGWEVRK